MSGEELVTRLENLTLSPDQFHHADHVYAAWSYLKRFPATQAIEKFSHALRIYAAFQGKANRYHETITWAYLLLVNERIARTGSMALWEQFAQANSDLFDWKSSILLRYYRKETLESDLARKVFCCLTRNLNKRAK